MSFLGGGRAPSGSGINADRIEAATAELEIFTDVFNRIVASCHSKCVSTRYAEGDLNKGESVCIDRCVAKFFDVNKKIGERLQSLQANSSGTGAPGSAFGSLG